MAIGAARRPGVGEPFAMGRYALVGLVNISVDAGGFILLASGLGMTVPMANALSFSSAILTSYLLNSAWTFRDRSGRHRRKFALFVLINLIGLMLSTMIVLALAQIMDKVAAKSISIPIIFFYNYFAASCIVFRRERGGNA